MSLAARARTKGSRATWCRQTSQTETADGRREPVWVAQEADVSVLIEPITFDLAQKIFGAVEVVTDRGWVAGERAFQPGDAMVVTKGPRLGTKYRLVNALLYPGTLATAHAELALVSTTEVGLP